MALRAAVPTGGRRSLACRAISPSGVRAETGVIPPVRVSAAAALEVGAPVVLALVLGLRCAALTLAGWSVIGAGFALPRDAGRRPALQPCSRLFSVCGARRSRWQDGASSGRVSRSRAMPVGDRRSSRARACSRSVVRGVHVGRMERHRSLFRAPARCRSETGAPVVRAASSVGGPRREGSHPDRLGFRPPRRCAPRCRPEVGVPLPACCAALGGTG